MLKAKQLTLALALAQCFWVLGPLDLSFKRSGTKGALDQKAKFRAFLNNQQQSCLMLFEYSPKGNILGQYRVLQAHAICFL